MYGKLSRNDYVEFKLYSNEDNSFSHGYNNQSFGKIPTATKQNLNSRRIAKRITGISKFLVACLLFLYSRIL